MKDFKDSLLYIKYQSEILAFIYKSNLDTYIQVKYQYHNGY